MNTFIFRMAWRETRGAWRHFTYFLVCIAVGVGALVSVSLFAVHVDRAVTREARGLLGGDLELRASRPLNENGLEILTEVQQRGIASTHVSELVAMAARTNLGAGQGPTTQIVELKAVETGYPFYGMLRLDPPGSIEQLLYPEIRTCEKPQPCYGALVQEALLVRMGLAIGEKLKIGQATFIITGIVRMEPDRMANAFSLGPRVLISQDGLRASELLKPGSRVRERYLLKLPPSVTMEPLRGELRGRLSGTSVRVAGYRDAQPQLKQFLEQLARYLGLIGLTALLIGGLGVAMSIHAFIREKLKTVAILKTLGADSNQVMQVYVVQALGLGLLGSLVGMAVGVVIQHVLPPLLTDVFATEILDQLGVSLELSAASLLPLIKGGLMGLLASLLFTVWPLLAVRDVSPAAILRQAVEPSTPVSSWRKYAGLHDPWRVGTAAILSFGFLALAVWQAGSWKIGALFIGGVSVAALLLVFSARILLAVMRTLPRLRSVTWRYAAGNVSRPGGQTTGIVVAIGVSVMIIVTVSLVERALLAQVGETRPQDAPTFFFIDIQPDQRDQFAELVRHHTGGRSPELTPLVRSRLHKINGELVRSEEEREEDKREDDKEERRKQWYVTREYVLTFLDKMPKGNEVVKGRWWEEGAQPSAPLLSVEEEAANAMGLDLGALVEFDIQGAIVSAEVASTRKVDWGNFSTNFYMILSPGSLDGAPLTYVGTIHTGAGQEVPLQQAIVAALPNVSAIHVGDVLENFGRVLDRLALAIRAVALFCLLAGSFVMASALAATRYRRLYESVILKAVGATRALIAGTFAVEYLLVGALGGTVAVILASVLSWVILTYVFELPWRLQPAVLASGLGLTVVLTLLVGCLSTFRLLGERPLAVLRRE